MDDPTDIGHCRYCGILPDQDLPRPSYQELRAEVEKWKYRAEVAENALVLATDHGMPAW